MKNKQKQPLSAEEAMNRMEAHCKSLGIPYSQNQKAKGTASIHFINKPKKDKS